MKKKFSWVIAVLITVGVLFSSCSAWEPDLGQDLLPSSDNVFLFYDTIIDIHTYTVTGKAIETSDRSFSNVATYLLGAMEDTITGKSEASLFTQFNTTRTYLPAQNTDIDSVLFSLFISDYFGNTEEDFTIRLYEATSRVYMDSIYHSDFEIEGAYDPVILAEKIITPQSGDTVTMLIENQAFIQKFLDVQADTSLFYNDSIFKDYFNGFYLTASSSASEGSIAKVIPSSPITRLSVKYANDSTEVDSTAERDFRWATFGINEYTTQKINIFQHDYSGLGIAELIDNPDIETPYCYVQGLAGVNTTLSFTNMQEWIDGGKVAINSATLIFDVVPDDLSGIGLEELPPRLMLFTESPGDSLAFLYDYYTLSQVDDSQFGGQLRAESKGMFFDTTYVYKFNMTLHFQSMVDGSAPDSDFRLRLYDSKRNPKKSMVWSNLFTNPKRIRLEVVYIKL